MPAFSKLKSAVSLAVAIVAALAMPAQAQQPSLPGGANTLNETHGAWTVTCAIGTQADGGQAKRCALSQTRPTGASLFVRRLAGAGGRQRLMKGGSFLSIGRFEMK